MLTGSKRYTPSHSRHIRLKDNRILSAKDNITISALHLYRMTMQPLSGMTGTQQHTKK